MRLAMVLMVSATLLMGACSERGATTAAPAAPAGGNQLEAPPAAADAPAAPAPAPNAAAAGAEPAAAPKAAPGAIEIRSNDGAGKVQIRGGGFEVEPLTKEEAAALGLPTSPTPVKSAGGAPSAPAPAAGSGAGADR